MYLVIWLENFVCLYSLLHNLTPHTITLELEFYLVFSNWQDILPLEIIIVDYALIIFVTFALGWAFQTSL